MIEKLNLEPLPVMIVDDDKDLLQNMEYEIKKHAEVQTFTNPLEALTQFQKQKYSVVVSDLKMPQMSGLDFLEKCTQIDPNCQRVLVTAYFDLEDIESSINQAQLNSILLKPWRRQELVQTVKINIRNSDTARENQELRLMAWSDALTGIANHRYFWERFEAEYSRAQRYKRNISLIMADIDNFKKFNDEKGHPEGDRILKKVAKTLDLTKRQMDTVARYGGEEFAIILPEADTDQSVKIATRFGEVVSKNAGVTLSFGIASFPNDAKSSSELLHLADQALLRAKRTGKNKVVKCRDL